tara:strand:+ start:248 stop:493 length:246 start_codon:yes stop_codon:yes gene_type:complete
MIIPVKCVTCGMVIADKFRYYVQRVEQLKRERGLAPNEIVYIDDIVGSGEGIEPSCEAIVLLELGVRKMCCKRHMLTHVDI